MKWTKHWKFIVRIKFGIDFVDIIRIDKTKKHGCDSSITRAGSEDSGMTGGYDGQNITDWYSSQSEWI